MNLACILQESLRLHPDKIAFEGDGRAFTFAQVDRLSENLAASLQAQGFTQGTRVAVMLPNIPEYALVVYGLWRLGAEPVLVNPQLTGPELLYILQDSESKVLVLPEALLEVFYQIQPQMTAVKLVVVGEARSGDGLNLMELMTTQGHCPVLERHPDDVAQVMYTSGTTGQPKGALLTHGNLLANARAGIEVLTVTDTDHLFCILPVFHAFALTAALVIVPMAGGSVSFEYRYSPKKLMAHVADPRLSVMVAVPSLLATILRFPEEFKLSPALRCILCGGGPLPPQLEAAFAERFGDVVRQGYGLTECAPYAAVNPFSLPPKPGSIGVSFPQEHRLAVRDPLTGDLLGTDQIGELLVRGPHVFKGYWNRPQATAESFVNGWLRTGDLGYCDENGYFYLVDRLKDIIVVGGENIYSREVEDALSGFAALREVGVVGRPDPDKGETVHAFVSLKEGVTASEAEIIQYARTQLAALKVPKQVTILSELPKSATGKILKRELRKLLS